MATSTQVRDFRRALDDLTTVATSDLVALLNAVDTPNPIEMRDMLLGTVPEVLQPYVTAAGELSAVWYEDLRADSGVPGSFTARVAADVAPERYDALVRFALTPLFGPSEATVASLMSGGSERIILNGSRDTIDLNARADVASVAWSRVARPGACGFCRMLAGRGAVYKSEASAGMVIGRGVDPSAAFDDQGNRKRGGIGKGVKSRGSRDVGTSDYHDRCHCTAVPTFYEVGEYVNPRTGRSEPALIPILETPIELEAA